LKRKKRICIVDDEIDVGLALKFILEEKGFRVDLFTDPVTASEIIKARRYDLFLIDIIMPDMNGFQIFKQIMSVKKRGWETWPNLSTPSYYYTVTWHKLLVDNTQPAGLVLQEFQLQRV
jgi:PleD family two-component response regulator